MTQDIKLVQGFCGEISYTLSFDGKDINVPHNTTVDFNFTDRRETKRYSIRCKTGLNSNEVVIPFTDQTSDYGEFYGEFVIHNTFGESKTDIYPIGGRIRITIRKRI